MKKFFIILAVVLMFTISTISLTGCGKKGEPTGGKSDDFDSLHISAIVE